MERQITDLFRSRYPIEGLGFGGGQVVIDGTDLQIHALEVAKGPFHLSSPFWPRSS